MTRISGYPAGRRSGDVLPGQPLDGGRREVDYNVRLVDNLREMIAADLKEKGISQAPKIETAPAG